MRKITKILIANRGEIAVRIIRTAREMNIQTVSVYSEKDRYALHAEMADESWYLGNGNLGNTYLDIPKIMDIAKQSNADAIHPGYGFLSENPEFPKACKDNNITFIGPDEEAIKIMGNKLEAAQFVASLNIPLLDIKTGSPDALMKQVKDSDFPLMIKAAAGGGGKGMRIIREPEKLEEALESTAREAKNYFGNASVYIEKYIENPKHIEIQVMGDLLGNYIHLNERECSVQRRHQKIVEEAPSPSLDEATRKKMGEAAVKIARAVQYSGAGTVEFLVDSEKNFHFLEMNTRIQVEHPVTEMITDTDLVREQIRIAQGMPLSWKQDDIYINGHAIEARIYAEDPTNKFMPSPGKIDWFYAPEHTNFRLDNGVRSGDTISTDFDPILAKAVAWGNTREEAIHSLRQNLEKIVITGIHHNVKYLSELLSSKPLLNNTFTTNYIDKRNDEFVSHLKQKRETIDKRYLLAAYIYIHSFNTNHEYREQAWNFIGYWRSYMNWEIKIKDSSESIHFQRHGNTLHLHSEKFKCEAKINRLHDHGLKVIIDNKPADIYYTIKDKHTEITIDGFVFALKHNNYEEIVAKKKQHLQNNKNGEKVTSPMFGKVVTINVEEEMPVFKGQTLMVLEAMKMENNIIAEQDSTIKHIAVREGEQVEDGQILIETKINE